MGKYPLSWQGNRFSFVVLILLLSCLSTTSYREMEVVGCPTPLCRQGTAYYFPSLHEPPLPLHPGLDPGVCVFIKGLPDSYCRKVENPTVETFPDIDGPR